MLIAAEQYSSLLTMVKVMVMFYKQLADTLPQHVLTPQKLPHGMQKLPKPPR
jgi:hypothetical protein